VFISVCVCNRWLVVTGLTFITECGKVANKFFILIWELELAT
jgi:hypothetical protein